MRAVPAVRAPATHGCPRTDIDMRPSELKLNARGACMHARNNNRVINGYRQIDSTSAHHAYGHAVVHTDHDCMDRCSAMTSSGSYVRVRVRMVPVATGIHQWYRLYRELSELVHEVYDKECDRARFRVQVSVPVLLISPSGILASLCGAIPDY